MGTTQTERKQERSLLPPAKSQILRHPTASTRQRNSAIISKVGRWRPLKRCKSNSAVTKKADATERSMQTRSMNVSAAFRQKSHKTPSFPKFSQLPKEVQCLIWASALAQEVPFVEAIIDRDSGMASS